MIELNFAILHSFQVSNSLSLFSLSLSFFSLSLSLFQPPLSLVLAYVHKKSLRVSLSDLVISLYLSNH